MLFIKIKKKIKYCVWLFWSALVDDIQNSQIIIEKLKQTLHDGLVVKVKCWIPNPGVPCSKPLGGSKVDSASHPSEVNKMGTRNFWEFGIKK